MAGTRIDLVSFETAGDAHIAHVGMERHGRPPFVDVHGDGCLLRIAIDRGIDSDGDRATAAATQIAAGVTEWAARVEAFYASRPAEDEAVVL